MNQDEKEDMARCVLDVNQERGITVVLIEHDMGVVMDISTRSSFSTAAGASPPARRGVQRNPAVIEAYPGTGRKGDTMNLVDQATTSTLPSSCSARR